MNKHEDRDKANRDENGSYVIDTIVGEEKVFKLNQPIPVLFGKIRSVTVAIFDTKESSCPFPFQLTLFHDFIGFGLSKKEAVMDLMIDFEFVWDEIAFVEDKRLGERTKKLKRKQLDLVKEVWTEDGIIYANYVDEGMKNG